MSAPLSEQQLADIHTRVNAATKGPWGVYDDGTGRLDIAADLEETGTGYTCRRSIAQTDEYPIDNDPTHRCWDEADDLAQSQADGRFIAHAREDVPALLTEVERLAADRAQIRAEVMTEAADMVAAMADPQCHCGGCDSCVAREYAKQLRALAGKDTGGGTQSTAGESTQPAQADRLPYLGGTIEPTVAYRSPVTNRLYCRACCTYPGMHMSLTSEDLPDGGICDECGTDVLIPQQTGTGEAL